MRLLDRLRCAVGLHDPAELLIERGRLSDVLDGRVQPTLEYRCRRPGCYREVERPRTTQP